MTQMSENNFILPLNLMIIWLGIKFKVENNFLWYFVSILLLPFVSNITIEKLNGVLQIIPFNLFFFYLWKLLEAFLSMVFLCVRMVCLEVGLFYSFSWVFCQLSQSKDSCPLIGKNVLALFFSQSSVFS